MSQYPLDYPSPFEQQPPNVSLSMKQKAQIGWCLLWDSRIPSMPKWLAPLAGLIYLVSPVDLIPDVVPVLTQIDDVGIIGLLFAGITVAMQRQYRHVVYEHAVSLGFVPLAGVGQRRSSPAFLLIIAMVMFFGACVSIGGFIVFLKWLF